MFGRLFQSVLHGALTTTIMSNHSVMLASTDDVLDVPSEAPEKPLTEEEQIRATLEKYNAQLSQNANGASSPYSSD